MLNRGTLMVFICAYLEIGTVLGIAQQSVTDEEVARLLPRTPYAMEGEEISNYKKLVAIGPAAYPSLIEELIKTDDFVVAARIMGIFVESKGDKALPIDAIKNLITKWSGTSQIDVIIAANAVEAIGEIGSQKDSDFLTELLSKSGSPRVRFLALSSLGKIGDENTRSKLQEWLTNRRSTLPPETQDKDPLLLEGERAVQSLDNRLKNSRSSPQQVHTPPIPETVTSPTPPIATEVKQSPSSFSIVPLAILVAVIVGIVVFLFKRKRP